MPMASAARRIAAAPAARPALPDEILEDIFLRLDAAADVARACAACTTFRRVVSSHQFRLRFRSLHTPPILGLLRSNSFQPAEPPHHAAPAARALAQAADFTFSFLPDPTSWRIRDASDGRILLSSRTTETTAVFVDLVVCDPLHRRYVLIPPIPDDLTTGTAGFGRLPVLAQSGGEESSFRVAWMVKLKLEGKVIAFVFSSDTGKWHRLTFDGWRGIGAATLTCCSHYTHMSIYQTSGLFEDVLMLDTFKMEFSVVRIPDHRGRQPAIVEAGEGRLGLLTLGDGMLDLYCKAWQDDGVGAEEWQLEKTIPLPDADRLKYNFSGAGSGYLLLQAIPRDPSELASSSQKVRKIQYFTLEPKTLLMERLCMSNKLIEFPHMYANFLPPLSLPSV